LRCYTRTRSSSRRRASSRIVGERKEIDFGVYATVEQPGPVRVGDAVEPL
jgi:hypothetical protein